MSDLLRPLLDTIERVRKHIQRANGWNEAQTRASLIDPILTALGWETADPELILHEFTSAGGRADYVLLARNTEIVCIVEAKALRNPLDAKEIGQTVNYANIVGAPYAALTDGDRWQLYEVFKKAKIEDRRILNVSLSAEETQAAALALLALWRPNVLSSSWRAVPAPIPGPSPVGESEPEAQPSVPSTDWVALPDFQGQKNVKPLSPIQLPDGSKLDVRHWKDLLPGVVRWLVQMGSLRRDMLPIPIAPGSILYVVNQEDRHKNGQRMETSEQVSPGFWVETWGDQKSIREHTGLVLTRCGQDPRKLLLRRGP